MTFSKAHLTEILGRAVFLDKATREEILAASLKEQKENFPWLVELDEAQIQLFRKIYDIDPAMLDQILQTDHQASK